MYTAYLMVLSVYEVQYLFVYVQFCESRIIWRYYYSTCCRWWIYQWTILPALGSMQCYSTDQCSTRRRMAPLENMSGTYCVKCPRLSRTPAIACSSTYIHVVQVVIHLTAETLPLSKCICTCTFTRSSIPGGCRFFTVPLNIHTYTCTFPTLKVGHVDHLPFFLSFILIVKVGLMSQST